MNKRYIHQFSLLVVCLLSLYGCSEATPWDGQDMDLERVINRDFGNGYDVEISNMNTTSLRKKARIYLWKDKKRIVDRVYDVPREDIGKVVDALYEKYGPNSAGCGADPSPADE